MKQIVQALRTGIIDVADVPVPTLHDNFVLVRNHCSAISAGTEKTKIDMGKKNLVQKALARPDLVKQVVNKMKTEGLAKTFQTVNTRLNSPSPMGYSSSGEVLAVGGLVKGVLPGDRVACAGVGYANHADFVAVPKNLVVKVPANVTDEEAAFTTIGAIALQGVRLSQPLMGETFLVLGLGLLGQITVQLLQANGCRVIGTDLDPALVDLAERYGALGIKPGTDPVNACLAATGGHGVDGVLVCAGTASNQPIELCGQATRKKGRVVVVGAVRMDIPREDYFKKEIAVTISCSYGPGRYDPFYEEAGNDYPLAYVRFSEQRNMETILALISQRKLDINGLITHRFPLERAADAYHLLEGKKKEPYIGIVLQYPSKTTGNASDLTRLTVAPRPINKSRLGVSFYGAGNYATASLLPILKADASVELRGIVTQSGRSAKGVAEQFDFAFCAGELDEILGEDTDLLMVATRHDTHASSVARALEAGKHVFVEKPLALNVEDLYKVREALEQASACQLMVGFNRRFAPLTKMLIQHFAGIVAPVVINIRVNAGSIPDDHWIQDPLIGGGRMIGEGCHFIDLAATLAQSMPVSVYAMGVGKANKSPVLNDNLVVSLRFANGSIATITYASDGSKAMPKEYIEVFGGGRSAVINDFKEAILYTHEHGTSRQALSSQDKGQKSMLAAWIAAIQTGKPCVSSEELLASSLATILAIESLMIDRPMAVDLNLLLQSDNH